MPSNEFDRILFPFFHALHLLSPPLTTEKKKAGGGGALSFGGDDEEGDGDAEAEFSAPKKVKKNPSVDSSFLPDKERDEALAKRREELAEEYKRQQDAIKAELIEVRLRLLWLCTGLLTHSF